MLCLLRNHIQSGEKHVFRNLLKMSGIRILVPRQIAADNVIAFRLRGTNCGACNGAMEPNCLSEL